MMPVTSLRVHLQPASTERRAFLRTAASAVGAASVLAALGRAAPAATGTPAVRAEPTRARTPQEILALAGPARPLKGGPIPADLSRRIGTAHVSGRYFFTDKPFLIEGAERVHALGLGGIKLWLGNLERSYPFNSSWNLPLDVTLEQIARHPYFSAAFASPFTVIALELLPTRLHATPGERRDITHPEADFRIEEEQVFALVV